MLSSEPDRNLNWQHSQPSCARHLVVRNLIRRAHNTLASRGRCVWVVVSFRRMLWWWTDRKLQCRCNFEAICLGWRRDQVIILIFTVKCRWGNEKVVFSGGIRAQSMCSFIVLVLIDFGVWSAIYYCFNRFWAIKKYF